jgi:hypothetical protein
VNLKLKIRVLRQGVAMLGIKPGKRPSVSLLLTRDEIPGDQWKRVFVKTFRPLSAHGMDDEIWWAKQFGCIVAVVQFRDVVSGRTLGINITPWATSEDAQKRVTTSIVDGPTSLRDMKAIEDLDPGAGSEFRWPPRTGIRKWRIIVGQNSGKIVKIAYGSEGRVSTSVTGTGSEDQWEWSEVKDLLDLQLNKIRRGNMGVASEANRPSSK